MTCPLGARGESDNGWGPQNGKTLPRGILLLMVTVCVMKKIALHWPDGPFFNTQRSAHSYIREIGNACSFFLGQLNSFVCVLSGNFAQLPRLIAHAERVQRTRAPDASGLLPLRAAHNLR